MSTVVRKRERGKMPTSERCNLQLCQDAESVLAGLPGHHAALKVCGEATDEFRTVTMPSSNEAAKANAVDALVWLAERAEEILNHAGYLVSIDGNGYEIIHDPTMAKMVASLSVGPESMLS